MLYFCHITLATMPRRFPRTCPLCGRPELKNLSSSHLFAVHNLIGEERTTILRQAQVSSWHPTFLSSTAPNHAETKALLNQSVSSHPKEKKRPFSADLTHGKEAKSSKPVIKKRRTDLQNILTTEPYPEFSFRHKFSLLVVGPSQSGKTHFVQQLLETDRIVYEKNRRRKIIWYYSQWQKKYDELRKSLGHEISFIRGLPEFSEDLREIETKFNNIIVLDDLMAEAIQSPVVSKLFTLGRHRNASTILLLQNMFPKGKYNTDISRNAQYIALFRSPSDRKQIGIVAERMFDKNRDRFMAVFNEVTSKPYTYILIDNKPETEAQKQVLGDVFGSCCVYAQINTSSLKGKTENHTDRPKHSETAPRPREEVDRMNSLQLIGAKHIPVIKWSDASVETWQKYLQGAQEMKAIPQDFAITEMYLTSRNQKIPGSSCCMRNGQFYWPVKLTNLKNSSVKWVYLHNEEPNVTQFVAKN